jgi:hypothetical protein
LHLSDSVDSCTLLHYARPGRARLQRLAVSATGTPLPRLVASRMARIARRQTRPLVQNLSPMNRHDCHRLEGSRVTRAACAPSRWSIGGRLVFMSSPGGPRARVPHNSPQGHNRARADSEAGRAWRTYANRDARAASATLAGGWCVGSAGSGSSCTAARDPGLASRPTREAGPVAGLGVWLCVKESKRNIARYCARRILSWHMRSMQRRRSIIMIDSDAGAACCRAAWA